MLRGASAEALTALTDQVTSSGTPEGLITTGEELFGVAAIVGRDAALRRALTDSSVEGEARAGLARAVFGSAVGAGTVDLVADAAQRRWTSGRDLPLALERLAAVATVRSAGKDAETVGDEIFAVRRLIDTNPELRSALSDQTRTAEDRSSLLDRLLKGKILPATTVLVRQAVSRGRGSIDAALEEYLDVAAQALEEAVATVHTAHELTQAEQQRLAASLSKQYGITVQVHLVVDPALIGGMRVEIGDDVIDGAVVSRLDEARRRLAG